MKYHNASNKHGAVGGKYIMGDCTMFLDFKLATQCIAISVTRNRPLWKQYLDITGIVRLRRRQISMGYSKARRQFVQLSMEVYIEKAEYKLYRKARNAQYYWKFTHDRSKDAHCVLSHIYVKGTEKRMENVTCSRNGQKGKQRVTGRTS